MPDHGDILGLLPTTLPAELVEVLVDAPPVRVERIVSTGQASPAGHWYDQDEHEFVLVVAGAARIAWDDGTERALGAGEWVWIPSHVRHRVAWTDPDRPTVWLAVFTSAGPTG